VSARILAFSALVFLTGCPKFQKVAVIEPASAHVVILEGIGTAAMETQTPFAANFEGVSIALDDAYRLRFDLDAGAAKRFGVDKPLSIYGYLSVPRSDDAWKSETLRLEMPEEKLQALVHGQRSQVTTVARDQLTRLVLRMDAQRPNAEMVEQELRDDAAAEEDDDDDDGGGNEAEGSNKKHGAEGKKAGGGTEHRGKARGGGEREGHEARKARKKPHGEGASSPKATKAQPQPVKIEVKKR
jgi:hypothetical protein